MSCEVVMKEQLVCYKRLPVWSAETIPTGFKEQHNTQLGTWAKLTILKGQLTFALLTEQGDVIETLQCSDVNQPPWIEPQQWHKIVSGSRDLECQLAFYCLAEDYSQKKYGFTPTHSEVIEAVKQIKPCKVLDLGCGSGRNAVYLNKLGFDVTAVDKNELNIAQLIDIIEKEQLVDFTAEYYDINNATIEGVYGFIISTVVLMFLDRDRIPFIFENMKRHTLSGGYNLIVAAMSTEDFPCPLPFSFTFKENELKDYYHDWQIIKYNEDIGELHKTDTQGNRIKLRFATLLAKKKD